VLQVQSCCIVVINPCSISICINIILNASQRLGNPLCRFGHSPNLSCSRWLISDLGRVVFSGIRIFSRIRLIRFNSEFMKVGSDECNQKCDFCCFNYLLIQVSVSKIFFQQALHALCMIECFWYSIIIIKLFCN